MCKRNNNGHLPTVWRYSFLFHPYAAHAEDGLLPDTIDATVWVDMFVTREEEAWLEIGAERTAEFMAEHHISDSDGLQAMIDGKRARSDSMAVEVNPKHPKAQHLDPVIPE
jgi:hypothetical protein